MSMRETRKKRRENSRAALRSVAAAPSFKAVRKRMPKRTRARMAMIASAMVAVMTTMLFVAPKTARAGFDVPEIDPGSMAGALTLLVGGVLALTDRVRRV